MQINKRKSKEKISSVNLESESKKWQSAIDDLELENKIIRQKLAECVEELQEMTKINQQLKKESKSFTSRNKSTDSLEKELQDARAQIEMYQGTDRESKDLQAEITQFQKANKYLSEENARLKESRQQTQVNQPTDAADKLEIHRLNMIIDSKETEIKTLEYELDERIAKQSENSQSIHNKIELLVKSRTDDLVKEVATKERKIRQLETKLSEGVSSTQPKETTNQSKESIADVMIEANDVAKQLLLKAQYTISKEREAFLQEKNRYNESLLFFKEKIMTLESDTMFLLNDLLVRTEGLTKIQLDDCNRTIL